METTMTYRFNVGDDVWWWTDLDPGNAEVGPDPCIIPVRGRYLRTDVVDGQERIVVQEYGCYDQLEDGERSLHVKWLLSPEEVSKVLAEEEEQHLIDQCNAFDDGEVF